MSEEEYLYKPVPKITQEQHDHIVKILEDGGLVENVLVYLGITRDQGMDKMNLNLPRRFDKLFTEALEKGEVLAAANWIKRTGEAAERESKEFEWHKHVLKNRFGWKDRATSTEPINLEYDHDNPDKAVGQLIQLCIKGGVSEEKAKSLLELISQGYAVKEVEQIKYDTIARKKDIEK